MHAKIWMYGIHNFRGTSFWSFENQFGNKEENENRSKGPDKTTD